MADKVSNRKSSAVPEQQKVNTTAQEIIRRHKNTSTDLDPEVIEDVLQEYMSDLEQGGYPEVWMWAAEAAGEGQVNRPGSSTQQKRRWNRLMGKQTWFKRRIGGKKGTSADSRRDKKRNPSKGAPLR